MNIWAWVEQMQHDLRDAGHDRVAEIMGDIPWAVCEERHDEVEAMAAEATQLAINLKQPWVEIFVRHWRAQSQILSKRDLSKGLFEVMSLFELSQRPENRDCPQSICVTQDLCVAYSVMDGPGYGVERLAASSETLARINPKWPCYSCISREHLSALLDLRQFADAEKFALQQIAQISANQAGTQLERLYLAQARLAMGNANQALDDLDFKIASNIPKHNLQRQKLQRALCFCQLGRLDEARNLRVPASKIEGSEYVLWAQTEVALIRCGALSIDKKLAGKIERFRNTAKKNNALFDQVQLTLALLELSHLANDAQASEQILVELATLRTGLRRPEFLDQALAKLRDH